MSYVADKNRYQEMKYNRCGKSGLLLPAITLGLWHNFGDENSLANVKEMLFGAFDMGITHFDLAIIMVQVQARQKATLER